MLMIISDWRDYLAVKIVCGLLPPAGRVKSVSGEFRKFTIAESYDSIILFVKTSNDVNPAIQRTRDYYTALNLKTQPFILVIGEESQKHIEHIYVVVDSLLLAAHDLKTAIDLCFKCFFVFNLEYTLPSAEFWQFIETILFKLKLSTKISSNVALLARSFILN